MKTRISAMICLLCVFGYSDLTRAEDPYSADAAPLMTSTWPRSIGGTCIRLNESPLYSGKPSASSCAYRPRSPWMRTLVAPNEGAVVCSRSPVVSPSSMATEPGRGRVGTATVPPSPPRSRTLVFVAVAVLLAVAFVGGLVLGSVLLPRRGAPPAVPS